MEDVMSKQCEFCGKKPQTGYYVSHSKIKTKRAAFPRRRSSSKNGGRCRGRKAD